MKRAFQWDLARQIERPDFLISWLPRYAEWGYNQVYLYLEDAFAYPSLPGVGRKRAWSPHQMDRFLRVADRHGLEVVPIVPLMGHAMYLLKDPSLLDLSETRKSDGTPVNEGQLCPLHERTLEVMEKCIRDMQPYCSAGVFHASLDESFAIASCPRCRKEKESVGLAAHFAGHISRIREICRSHGLRLGMWADMFYYFPEAISLLPKDIIAYDWFYYSFRKRTRVEMFEYTEVDLTGRLRKAGWDVFGCPNNGPFFYEPIASPPERLGNIVSWWNYIREKRAQGMLITSWAPSRTALELNFAVDAAAASLWLNPGEGDLRRMYALGVERVFGRKTHPVAKLLFDAARYAHTGYFRWQADRDWRALANFSSPSSALHEERYFTRAAEKLQRDSSPEVVRDIFALRKYIAVRQRFLRTAGKALVEGRRTVARGCRPTKPVQQILAEVLRMQKTAEQTLRTVEKLWKRSRYVSDPNPVAHMIREERARLEILKKWVKRAERHPEVLWEGSPLMGRWQLLFYVRTFAVAQQAAFVEMRMPDGSWKEIHRLYALEFSDASAWPQIDIRHRHSVPVDWKGDHPLEIRLGVQGVGRLEVYDVVLSDGVETLRPHSLGNRDGTVRFPRRLLRNTLPGTVFGKKPVTRGFPQMMRSSQEILFSPAPIAACLLHGGKSLPSKKSVQKK